MEITAQMVKELRDRTGAGMMDCKKALSAAGGDMEKAIEELRKKGLASAAKKADRETHEGSVGAYIHATMKLGVLIEVNCETDFVAKTDDFQVLVKDLAMQVAASNPLVVSREELDNEMIEKEREIYREKMLAEGKPENMVDKIVDGMLEKRYYKDVCLLEQDFIKDTEMTVQDYINTFIAKLGENIQVRRFTRYSLGE